MKLNLVSSISTLLPENPQFPSYDKVMYKSGQGYHYLSLESTIMEKKKTFDRMLLIEGPFKIILQSFYVFH